MKKTDRFYACKLCLLSIIFLALFISCYNPWMADILDPLYNATVTFYCNGGTPVASIKVKKGSTIDTPPVTTREGLYFNGWHDSWSLNSPVTFPYTVYEDTTLYAGWTNSASVPSLSGITAEYKGTETIYPTTPRDSLKNDLTVTAHFTDGTQTQVNVSDYTITGELTVGTSTITVTYDEYTVTFNVTVTAVTLSSISAIYTQGTTIYPTTPRNSLKNNLLVTAHFTDETQTQLDAADYTLTGGLDVGTSTITVNYSEHTTSFNVTVTAVTLSSISVIYTQGTTIIYPTTPLDSLKNDLTVTAHFTDGVQTQMNAADYTLTGELTVGTSAITVTRGGHTATFDVTVDPHGAELGFDLQLNGNESEFTISTYSGPADVVIPAFYDGIPIIGIGNFAFENSDITSITFEEDTQIKTIGFEAFRGSKNLKSVIIPDSVESIYGSAFEQCVSLESVIIPNGVKEIGGRAFYQCTALESIILPASVTSIGSYAFAGCTSLGILIIEESGSSMSIGENAFSGNLSLSSVVIPARVRWVAYLTFRNCPNLREVEFKADFSASLVVGRTTVEPNSFDGDLYNKFRSGGAGVYTTTDATSPVDTVWTK